MQVKYIKVEAQRLVHEHGAEAFIKTQEAIRTAKRKRDPRRGRFLERVALEILRSSGGGGAMTVPFFEEGHSSPH